MRCFFYFCILFVFTLTVSVNSFASELVFSSLKTPTTQSFLTPNVKQSDAIRTISVKCAHTETSYVIFRASILSIADNFNGMGSYDIAITAGHGLLDDNGSFHKDCYISTVDGQREDVLLSLLPDDYKSGSPSDWGLVIFPRLKSKNIIRYNSFEALDISKFEELASNHFKVLFPLARGIFSQSQECRLHPREKAGLSGYQYYGFLSHDCSVTRGQSGSPVSLHVNDVPILVGLHIGQSYALNIPATPGSRPYGYLRVVDDELIDEVSALLSQLTVTDWTLAQKK